MVKKTIRIIIYEYLLRGNRFFGYSRWVRENFPTKKELYLQRKIVFPFEPTISIIVPIYDPPNNLFIKLLFSVQKQTYANWELILVDGGKNKSVEKHVRDIFKNDKRVKYFTITNRGIAQNTNYGLEKASGDYISFLDHDDELRLDCLYQNIKVLNSNPQIDLLYSDEYQVNVINKKIVFMHFKPDFSPDTLRTINYICHFLVVKKDLLEQVGYLREGFEGSQDYDLILRLTEKTKNIYHISMPLYQWNFNPQSFSQQQAKVCNRSSVKAISEHLRRVGLAFHSVLPPQKGTPNFKVNYKIVKKDMVSIIIPNKDQIKLLKKCINAIYKNNDYKKFEVIIVENNSQKASTFKAYKSLQDTFPNLRVVEFKTQEFNFSAKVNYGVEKAKGKYVLLLNNDIQVIHKTWLSEMVMFIQRDDVGAVGNLLLFEDKTIQHAGITLRLKPNEKTIGIAGNTYKTLIQDAIFHYQYKAQGVTNTSAVTGACLLTKKSLFKQIKGFDEKHLKVAFNDVDYCLKILELNKLVVHTPYSKCYHFESKSRGYDELENERFKRESKHMISKWFNNDEQDKYYNTNLTLSGPDYNLNFDKNRKNKLV